MGIGALFNAVFAVSRPGRTSDGQGGWAVSYAPVAAVGLTPRAARWDIKEITADAPAEGHAVVASSPAVIRRTTTRAVA